MEIHPKPIAVALFHKFPKSFQQLLFICRSISLDIMPPPNTPTNRSADLAPFYGDYLRSVGYSPPAPPSSPESDYVRSRRATRESQYLSLNHQMAEVPTNTITPSLNLPDGIDYRALAYDGDVDENLMCPICHAPLVDPVDTECGHTFCRECIAESLAHSEVCPMDRQPLSRHSSLRRSHKIVLNQLDALLVQCICCEASIPRSMLHNHVERYCKDALVTCPSKTCNQVVKRHLSDKGCLHYDVTCPDCKEVHQEIAMVTHRENVCMEREKDCEHCGEMILRCKESEHVEQCPNVITRCEWVVYGCQHESKRKDLPAHAGECTFRLMGPMVNVLKDEIGTLHSRVELLMQKDEFNARRIKFLESGWRDSYRSLDLNDISSQPITNLPEAANDGLLDTLNEYVLSLIESLESRVRQLSAGMNELEAKQTMMLFNETMPIKNEMAELRSTQQVISMHVRWLLNFRRQENQRRVGIGGPGSNGGSDGGGSNSDMALPRRLSDSTPRDIMTRL